MSILSRRAGSKLQGAVQGVAGSFGGMESIVGLTTDSCIIQLA